MRLEKFFDPFAVFRKLILHSKKHFNQAQGEHAFGVSGRFAATELGGICEEFHSSWAAFSKRWGVGRRTSKPTSHPSLRASKAGLTGQSVTDWSGCEGHFMQCCPPALERV